MLRLETVRDGLPEMSAPIWQRLGGADAATHAFHRGVLLAYADAMDAEYCVGVLEDGDRVRGLAAGLVNRAASDRPVLSLLLPGTLEWGPHGRGLWLAADERDHADALRHLLAGVLEHARPRGLRVVASFCAPEDVALRQAAEALGGRVLPAPPAHKLTLAPTDTFDDYLARLLSKRRNIVRDLRRPAESGATVVIERPVSEETLRRCWPLQLDHYRRYQEPVLPRPGENLFLRLHERLAGEQLGAVLCLRDGKLLGFMLFHRIGTASQFLYIGHVPVEEMGDLQVYVSLVSHYLKHEIHDGARTFFFGYHHEQYKARLGFSQHAQVHYYFAAG